MTTRGGMRTMIRGALTDLSTWPDTKVNTWINEAIQDYSNYFPTQVEAYINCVTAQRIYSLSAYTGIMTVLQVEYPNGEEPPRFLLRRPETGNFFNLPVYDLRGDPPTELVTGEEPTTGEKIRIIYNAQHAAVNSDSASLTVPDKHLEAIKLYVVWQAVKELEMNEQMDPDTKTLILNTLGINAYRSERSYNTIIRDYLESSAPGGYSGPWQVDRYDRIY